jgi:homopolymeric O-antigen transport system permease protein
MSTSNLNIANVGVSAPSGIVRFELPANPWRQAAADLINGARAWQCWGMLGWHDIRQRYRRSALGPFWITITMGITIGSIGVVFGALLGQNMHEFLPYVAAGNIVWALLSTMISEGCMAFINSEAVIKQVKLPHTLHIFRLVWRSLIIFGHNIWVFVATAILFALWPTNYIWWAILGMTLVMLNGIWMVLFLAIVSARFRDIPLVAGSALQLLYLTTPIIWHPDSLRGRHSFVFEYNPLYHLLELVRAPLLGHAPTLANWTVGIAFALLGWGVAFSIFARYRWRIAYWV